MPDQIFCRFCGKGIPADSQFCPHCGKSQGQPVSKPAGEASPPAPSPTSQQPSPPEPGVSEKKARKIPIVVWVIAGLIGVCCIGVVVLPVVISAQSGASIQEIVILELNAISNAFKKSATESVLRETYFPEATLGSEQADLTRKWTPPFMALMMVERQAQELIETIESVEAGTLTMEEFEQAYAVNPYTMADILFFSFDEYKGYLTEETEWKVDPAVQSFVDGLDDDYIKLTETTMEWWGELITPAEAIEKVNETQAALAIEREKMHQAAKMDGMGEDVYLGLQDYLEDEWPGMKAKWTDIARRMLTPQP